MRPLSGRWRLSRPAEVADEGLVDVFLVSAVATVILIRVVLTATGFPQLGGHGLHIAHAVWGGFGMLVAMLFLLVFISSTMRFVSALIGGAGFGAFIDELGKFVTSDNNYFFKPTAALVYVLFVVLFLAIREVSRARVLTAGEKLANALGLAEGIALRHLGEGERAQALELLTGADQADPLVGVLRARFQAAEIAPPRLPLVRRIGAAVRARSASIAANPWFRRFIIGWFVLDTPLLILSLAIVGFLILLTLLGVAEAGTLLESQVTSEANPLTIGIELVASTIAAVLMVRGILALRRSRLLAYREFERAVLVDLLLAKPFDFLSAGFPVAAIVFVDLVLLVSLRALDALERQASAAHPIPTMTRADVTQPIST